MIPIAHWLNDQDSFHPVMHSRSMEDLSDPVFETSCPANKSELESGRERELEASLRVAEALLIEERIAHESRERNLRIEFTFELAESFKSELNRSLSEFRQCLESALVSILRPFLGEQMRSRAISDLMAIIKAELEVHDQSLLEICAPADLHECLSSVLAELSISASLSVSHRLEFKFANAQVRCDLLTARWLATLEGRAT